MADTGYALNEIVQRATLAAAYTAAVAARRDTGSARPTNDINHVLAYGESFATGWEGWPALSRTQPHDSLMLGTSVRGIGEATPHWAPFGEPTLHPLAATVMTTGPDAALLDDAAVAALPAGNGALGETPLEGAVNQWRHDQLRANPEARRHRLLATACGVGGRSIEALAPQGPLFGRLADATRAGRQAAEASGQSYGVAAVMWLQGENNAAGTSGTADRAEYKAQTAALHQAIRTELPAISGQPAPPAVFAHQTSAAYVRDATFMAVPQAQFEYALEAEGWYLAAPAYPVTDKGHHLDANGYRWLGLQFGKVMHRVLDLGQGWRPLHPLRASVRGTHVLIDFHVPHAPLVFDACWARHAPVSFQDGGFTVADAEGRIAIAACAVVADRCVLLVLERAAGPGAVLSYGDQTHHKGLGNLRDSDPTEAAACYEYAADKGHAPSANIPALTGKPYPLWNWCVLFRIAIQPDPAPVVEAVPEPAPEPAPQPAPEPPPAPPPAPTPAPPPAFPLEDAEPPPPPDTPAWQVLRGVAPPPEPEPAPPPRPSWLRRLLGS